MHQGHSLFWWTGEYRRCIEYPRLSAADCFFPGARSNTKCNIYGRQCCMGKTYQQLSIEERTMIQTQLEMGIRPAAIAVGLNRSASTLSRELRRNGWTRRKAHPDPGRPPVAGGYRAGAPHQPPPACTGTPRGAWRTEVIGWLRFGQAKRRPRARGEDRRGKIPDMVSIHERPPEIDERLVPGHGGRGPITGAENP